MHRGALVGLDWRPQLEHLAPEARHETGRASPAGDLVEIFERNMLVLRFAVVEGNGQALVLHRPVDIASEASDPLCPFRSLRLELEAMGADVGDALDADHAPCVLTRPAADA